MSVATAIQALGNMAVVLAAVMACAVAALIFALPAQSASPHPVEQPSPPLPAAP